MPRLLSILLSGLLASGGGLPFAGAQSRAPDHDESVMSLAKFIATESALSDSGDIRPTSRPVAAVFGPMSVQDTPRAVTVLTPELMARFDIQDFSDFGRIGAGTQQINYYGVPGTPAFRGIYGGVFFNGMQRAYQRNEMPLSFGSVEAMDLVKGPAPAHYGATQVGGYVNLLPKSPFFDRRRSRSTLEAGTDGHHRAQIDTGGPFQWGERPAAYRLSVTGQYAGTSYDRVRNDFVSLYGSLKVQLSPRTTLFTGAEAFRFRSNENAGWNRPTQRLIDDGQYIIGEPINIASSAWGGRVNRDLLYQNPALVVAAPVVDGGVSRGFITAAQRRTLLDLSDPADRARAYAGIGGQDLATITPTTSGYQYTPAYFAAGGRVFTAPIAAGTVLASADDFADADNLLYFADLVSRRDAGATFTGQFLLDYLDTDKRSTYGYAANTRQLILEAKASHHQSHDWLDLRLTTGASARRARSVLRQDFFDEPFSRRDITQANISANTVVPTGDQTDPEGRNFWSPTSQGGANADSELWQLSAFAYAESRPFERLATYTSFIATHAPYRTRYPRGVDRVPASDVRRNPVSAERNHASFSFSPVWAVTAQGRLYATWQRGTSIDPLDGGAILGKGNFAANSLSELGLKIRALDDALFAALAVYQWELTAFNERDNAAEELAGEGVEFELTYAPSDRFSLIGSIGHQEVRRLTPLGFRAVPLTAEQWALHAGQLNHPGGGIAPAPGFGPYARPAANPDLIYPGTPQDQAKLYLHAALPAGWALAIGARWSAPYWHNFDRTLKLPATTVFDATLTWSHDDWKVALHGFNLSDQDVFRGAEPVFGANTLVTRGEGPAAKLVIIRRF